ncbi:hypothetical protein K8I31_05015, partial [bacterium]|nr:hypothetical protein [bacterium]
VMKAVKRGRMTLIPYYSDPEITYQGASIGRENESVDQFGNTNSANNAQVIRNTISFATQFRPTAEPEIKIVTPAANQVFSSEDNITVSASVHSEIQNINSIHLIVNGIDFAAIGAPIYEYTIPILPPGAYTLVARAILNDDTELDSLPISITVNNGWSSAFGRNGHELPVNDIAVRRGIVYTAGEFTEVGSVEANHVARWDSYSWSVFGNAYQDFLRDFRNSQSLTVCGNDIYLGWDHGEVTRINELAGEEFDLGFNASGSILAMKANGSKLYVGGEFKRTGSPSFNYIGVWDEEKQQWSNLGSPLNGAVYALALDSNYLYVGGEFTHAGDDRVNHIVAWDLQRHHWLPLGEGVNDRVASIAFHDDQVYVGGEFTLADETPVSHIAVWDWLEQQWSSLGTGVNDSVLTLAAKDGSVFAGGEFTSAGGKATSYIARWDKTSQEWNPLGKGVNGPVRTVSIYGNSVYVGGDFDQAGRWPAMNFSEWRSDVLIDSERSSHFVSQFPTAIDIDNNRNINESDILYLHESMNSSDEIQRMNGDFNRDGVVNSKDLFMLYSYWQMNRECECD